MILTNAGIVTLRLIFQMNIEERNLDIQNEDINVEEYPPENNQQVPIEHDNEVRILKERLRFLNNVKKIFINFSIINITADLRNVTKI